MRTGANLATLKLPALTILAAILLISSPAEMGGATVPQAPTDEVHQAFVPGELIVKFKDSVTESVSNLISRGGTFRSTTADRSDSLDRLSQRYKVEGARPAFRTPVERRRLRDTSLVQLRRHHLAKVESVKRRFPTRSRRAPEGATIPDLSHVYVLELSKDADVGAAAAAFAADPHVEYAQPNYLAQVQFVPDDHYYSSAGSWGQPYDDLWGLKKIQAEPAWDVTQGQGTVVAVVDTGLDYTHPDIAQNVWTNPGEIAGNGVDDDANGYVDDVRGWDFVTYTDGVEDNDPMDGHFHGTHVSGTIAAVGNNGIGIIGVAPQAKIMALKGLNDMGAGTSADLANALRYAADNGADVINNSWSCNLCPSNPAADEAVRYAHGLGAVVVFAAANTTRADSAGMFIRSPQNKAETIVVSAFDQNDAKAFFTNYGTKVDVAAPGGGTEAPPPDFDPHRSVLSLLSAAAPVGPGSVPPELVVGGGYLRQAGTSMAAPHVAGVAALVLARRPSFTNEEVRQVLRVSADDVDAPGFDAHSGRGRINAARALTVDAVLRASFAAPAGGADFSFTGLNAIEIRGTAGGPGFVSYQLSYAEGVVPTEWWPIASSTTPVEDGLLATWDASALPSAEYSLRLEATDAQGMVYDAVIPIVIENPAPLREYRVAFETIVFDPGEFGSAEVYVMDAGGVHRLTDDRAWDGDPAFSPDGSQIAFVSDRYSGNSDIYVMNADGSGLTRLTDHPAGEHRPAWSPDGTRVAFQRYLDPPGGSDIFVMNADGSGETNLTDHPGTDISPAWSPDGGRIAFASSRAGSSNQIYVMNADGSSPTRLTKNYALDGDPAWSPDGSKIAFARDGNVFVMYANGGGQTQLTFSGSIVTDPRPSWSPDGSKIAFANPILNTLQDLDIYLMNPDGSGQTRLTVTPGPYGSQTPSWGPPFSDSDRDGLADDTEANVHGTDPLDPDSDDDGLLDGAEVYQYDTNPLDADTDDDGLTDGAEVNTHGTNPTASDTDNDGLSDGDEVQTLSTDPLDADSDDDGVADGLEVQALGTDPLDPDSDNDGLSDGAEDHDGDGCTNATEVAPGLAAAAGGQRDPLSFWDFMDMWAGGTRDRRINIIDIAAVVSRFATAGDPTGDSLDPPQAMTGYHVSADRTAPALGDNLWNAGPPNGGINIIEIALLVAQFGHSCA